MSIDPSQHVLSVRLQQSYGVAGPSRSPSLDRLIAAKVPQHGTGAALEPGEVRPRADAPLPMYRNPAMKNAIETAVRAGQVIDAEA